MKKKRLDKKLRLSRETLLLLDKDVRNVAGASAIDTLCLGPVCTNNGGVCVSRYPVTCNGNSACPGC
jgi:hypothetical protein